MNHRKVNWKKKKIIHFLFNQNFSEGKMMIKYSFFIHGNRLSSAAKNVEKFFHIQIGSSASLHKCQPAAVTDATAKRTFQAWKDDPTHNFAPCSWSFHHGMDKLHPLHALPAKLGFGDLGWVVWVCTEMAQCTGRIRKPGMLCCCCFSMPQKS